jgi:hypothetical protein
VMMVQPLRMIARSRYLALVAVALLLTGCAGGTQFVRPDVGVLILGKTTEAEVQQRIGDPMRCATASWSTRSPMGTRWPCHTWMM